jgi:hypothetical protein
VWLVHLRLDELHTRRALVERSAGWEGSPEGPVVLRGVLRAGAVPALPSGHPAALWAYSVTHHEGRRARQICHHTAIDAGQAPSLEIEGQQLPLAGYLGSDRPGASIRWPGLAWLVPDGSVAIHVGEPPARSETPPGALPADCRQPGTTYREGLLLDGAEVRVLGCKRAGLLVRCADGADTITTLDRPALAAALASNTNPLMISTAFSLISWFLLAGALLLSLPASPWRPRDAASRGAS